MPEKKAIYALSADPLTYGHIDIARRAARMFDEVHLLLAVNREKKYTLALEVKERLCREVFAADKNILVRSYVGLVADYARTEAIPYLVRGLRSHDDLGMEMNLSEGNRSQYAKLETVLLLGRPEYAHLSSTMVKLILQENGDIRQFVPMNVQAAMEQYQRSQFRLCVTGSIASGKSTLVSKLIDHIGKKGKAVHHIDMDSVTHEAYESESPYYYEKFLPHFKARFGEAVIKNERIDRKSLASALYKEGSKEDWASLSNLIRPLLETGFRHHIGHLKGLIFISAAMAAEGDWLWHTSNHCLLVHCNASEQTKRLMKRDGISEEDAERKIHAGGSYEQKKQRIESIIERDGYGELLEADTSESVEEDLLENLSDKINRLFPLFK